MKKFILLFIISLMFSCNDYIITTSEKDPYTDYYYVVISSQIYSYKNNTCLYNLYTKKDLADVYDYIDIVDSCGTYTVGDKVKFKAIKQ